MIGYTGVVLNQGFNNNFSELYKVYFLLSKFSCFKTEFKEELSFLKTGEIKMVFGILENFSCQKLSDDWRSRDRMNTDHTIMALLLFVSH